MKKPKVDLNRAFAQALTTTKANPPAELTSSYISSGEADALFSALVGIKWDTIRNRYGAANYRRVKTYYDDSTGSAKAETGYKSGGEAAANYMNAYGDKGSIPVPYLQAPQSLQNLRAKLQKQFKIPLSLCYINFYYNSKAGINWHADREERGCPDSLPMVTVYGRGRGNTRAFSILEMSSGKAVNAWDIPTGHGDLVVMPPGFHNGQYLHAVLDATGLVRTRISLTFRNPDLSPWGKWAWYQTPPQVWDCHTGKQYPKDAVYVGCKTSPARGNRKGSIFGNGKNPLTSHRSWIADNEKAFRAYALEKMRAPAFRKEVEALRGKHLLCWCVQDGPKRAPFCHARVWLELANEVVPPLVET